MATTPIVRTPIVDDDHTGTTGTSLDNAWKQQLYDQIDGVVGANLGAINTGPWTPYTPTWIGADGFGPGIGNGILEGRYVLIGKTCHFWFHLQIGSTTSVGTSSLWAFGLPVAPYVLHYGSPALFMNAGGGTIGPGIVAAYTAQSVYGVTSTGAVVNATSPFAWTTNCQLHIRGTYEAA